MQAYFQKNTDTAYLATDYETMGKIYDSLSGGEDSAAKYYALAAGKTDKATVRLTLYKKVAGLYDDTKNYDAQVYWLEKYYTTSPKPTNQDLFNWGIAYYYAGKYTLSDSVFGLYTAKYPDQDFGYYWRARSNVAIDTAMALGLAIPHYLKVIEIAEKDTTNELNRKRLVEGYGYIASYKANHDKDYAGSMEYFEKVVALQPENAEAKKYVAILQKMVDKQSN
jgi:tetratricopeptide (TPR) repeat protein